MSMLIWKKNATYTRFFLPVHKVSVGFGGRVDWPCEPPPGSMGKQQSVLQWWTNITTTPKIPRKATRSLALLILWEIWLERNNRVFNRRESLFLTVMAKIKSERVGNPNCASVITIGCKYPHLFRVVVVFFWPDPRIPGCSLLYQWNRHALVLVRSKKCNVKLDDWLFSTIFVFLNSKITQVPTYIIIYYYIQWLWQVRNNLSKVTEWRWQWKEKGNKPKLGPHWHNVMHVPIVVIEMISRSWS